MKQFDDTLHSHKLSDDGTYTAYSKEYDEHYHSTKDGALKESYLKHVIPAYQNLSQKDEVYILDICYGLGFNTLCTILYYKQHAPTTKLHIYSPELDSSLVKSLETFHYPAHFGELKEIISSISREGYYRDDMISIEVYLGDAREYIKKFTHHFDILYQDAFSPKVNPILWTKEYFRDISKAMKDDAIITTYSIAFQTRLALYENGFTLYLNEGEDFRTATLAAKRELPYKKVDMEHKISCNSNILSLRDDSV